jgi:hypothetical protein
VGMISREYKPIGVLRQSCKHPVIHSDCLRSLILPWAGRFRTIFKTTVSCTILVDKPSLESHSLMIENKLVTYSSHARVLDRVYELRRNIPEMKVMFGTLKGRSDFGLKEK